MMETKLMGDSQDIASRSPVIPVVTMPTGADPIALAETLLEGGLGIIEITLRSDAALAAIDLISDQVPEMWVGAGTVWTAEQAELAIQAGSRFLVSPGIGEPVLAASREKQVPLIPGAQTVSEVQFWRERGVSLVKFFPAEVAGGIPALKAMSSVFPDIQFCPTGGVTPDTALDYLALPQVACVGGSWITPVEALVQGDWNLIRQRATEAASLAGSGTNRE
jgi:2-dehydro-3-deoxyphosphogluconate aldolase/(4S)-4-hydroxy-2-oxoglutarate aldolase